MIRKFLRYQERFSHRFKYIDDQYLIHQLEEFKQYSKFENSNCLNKAFICFYNFLSYFNNQLMKINLLTDDKKNKILYKFLRKIIKILAKLLKINHIEFSSEVYTS